MQPFAQFLLRLHHCPCQQHVWKTNAAQLQTDKWKGMKAEAAVIRMRSDVCVCTFLSGKWWRLSRRLKSLCSLWMEVAVKTNNTRGKSCLRWTTATCLGPRTFSDVTLDKCEWTRVETVNWCNIDEWKSHVAYRDPDHTHTGLVLLKPPHLHINLKKRSEQENTI